MKLPVYELKISDKMNDDSEVSFIALVDEPAIQKDFLAFKSEFIQPSKGEHENEFMPRCIKYVMDEGKEQEQAIAICSSLWAEHFAGGISFDFDDTLSTSRGQRLAAEYIAKGDNVYIISARHDKSGMMDIAAKLGIPESRVYATGSNEAKIAKVKELKINKHFDNNSDVISQLGEVGQKFLLSNQFSIMNEDQRIISGPLMIADELIYRNNEQMGEHYVKFSGDTIKAIAIKFAKRKYQTNVNLMHDANQQVEGVTMFESWIVDKARGIKPMTGFEDVTDGSWFGSFYVENQDVWNQIKSGEYRGFSVEGLFDYDQPMSYEQQMLQKIKNLLFS